MTASLDAQLGQGAGERGVGEAADDPQTQLTIPGPVSASSTWTRSPPSVRARSVSSRGRSVAIVHAHEGRLWAENNPDVGATFLHAPDHVAPSIGHFWRHGNSVMKNHPSTSTAGSVKRSGLPFAHSRNRPTTSFRDGTGSGGQISGVSFSCLVSAMMVWYVPAPNP